MSKTGSTLLGWPDGVVVIFHCHLDSELRTIEFDNLTQARAFITETFERGLDIIEWDDDEVISITVFPPHLLGCPIIIEAE